MKKIILYILAVSYIFIFFTDSYSQSDSTKNKLYKLVGYKFDGGGIFNNLSISTSASFGTHGVLIDSMFDDYLTTSYDYIGLRDSDVLLKAEKALLKQKKLWSLNYFVTYKGKPFINVDYRSDHGISIHSTYLTGGMERKLPFGFNTKLGMGWKKSNTSMSSESFDVFKALMEYKTPQKGIFKLDAYVNMYLPRNKLINSNFGGLWIMDSKFLLSINKSILGVMPSINAKVTRDYIMSNKQYSQVVRYLLTLGVSRSGGNIGKLRK